jgi:uncharacterized protein YneF (UPF0154 family)
VKAVAPVLSAGGSFTVAALAGLALGIVLSRKTGQGWWVFAGLMGGLAVGFYGAFRLLQRSV